MKTRILFIMLFLLMAASCDEPETVVTNIVHSDGTVTRMIEMRNVKNNFAQAGLQVPFDSTWAVSDSIEISEKGDTTWVKRAKKLFVNVAEINKTYGFDSFANTMVSRNASFAKKFRWFNTEFRFSESIEKQLSYGYPLSDFLSTEELSFFYSPEKLKNEKMNGADSLKFKAINDSVSVRTDRWLVRAFVAGWIDDFAKLAAGKGGEKIASGLHARENEINGIIERNMDSFDSLWAGGIIQKEILGEDAEKFKTEADSAISLIEQEVLIDFKDYSVRTIMPGKLTGTNGFIDNNKMLLWPVRSEYFLTQPYEMWAESKVTNIWAWIISGLFILFVLAGVTLRLIKKG